MDESMLRELFNKLVLLQQSMNQTNLAVASSESLGSTSASQSLLDASTPVTNNLISNTGSSSVDAEETSQQEDREVLVQRRLHLLLHAHICLDVNCRFPSCQEMKQMMMHSSICKRQRKGCPVCKELMALYCYHAAFCQETNCLVSLCSGFKQGIKEVLLKRQMQEAELLSHLRSNCLG